MCVRADIAWAEVLGRLAASYPQLVLVGIDDFTLNIHGYPYVQGHGRFQPPYVARFTAG